MTLNKQSFWKIIAFGLPVFLDSTKKTTRKRTAVWWPKEKGKPQTHKAVSVWWPLVTFSFLSVAVCDSGKTALHVVSAKPAGASLSIFKRLSADAIFWKTKQKSANPQITLPPCTKPAHFEVRKEQFFFLFISLLSNGSFGCVLTSRRAVLF